MAVEVSLDVSTIDGAQKRAILEPPRPLRVVVGELERADTVLDGVADNAPMEGYDRRKTAR